MCHKLHKVFFPYHGYTNFTHDLVWTIKIFAYILGKYSFCITASLKDLPLMPTSAFIRGLSFYSFLTPYSSD